MKFRKCISSVIFFTLLPIILSTNLVYAYEARFHRELTRESIESSYVEDYLKDNLGLSINRRLTGPGSIWFGPYYTLIRSEVQNRTIAEWIVWGSEREDRPTGARAITHFYNPTAPLHPARLTDPYDFNRANSLQRARDDHPEGYAWADACQYYYLALTNEQESIPGEDESTSAHSRTWYFAQTFRALGQILHLLEDMGVPAHVRNDAHDPGYSGNVLYKERKL